MKPSLRTKVGAVAVAACFATGAVGQINTPGGATVPFGTNTSYPYGLMPTNADVADATTAYNSWKSQFVEECTDGYYRVKFEPTSETVSEGIAYGLLLAAYAADKDLFDGLWQYYDKFKNGNGVMGWRINGCSNAIDNGGAADAELDAAMALLVAEHQWPDENTPYDYSLEATELINAIRIHELDPNTKQIINGDGWGFGNSCRNPSYMAPAYYRLFAEHDAANAGTWNDAVSAAYTLINNNAHATTGLVSNWSDNSGSASDCGKTGFGYGYDACRNPWRMATDVIWNDNADAAAICNKIAAYTDSRGASQLRGPLNQDGSGGDHHNSTFVSTFAAGAMGAGTQYAAHLNSLYTENVLVNSGDYFGTTLRAIMTFMMTGNFWKPGEAGGGGSTLVLEDFDCSSNLTEDQATGTLSTVANPDPNSVNPSAMVAEYDRNAAQEWDYILYTMPTAEDIGTQASGITMDVYSPQAGIEVYITLRNGAMAAGDWPAGRHSDYIATTTKSGEWETLSFAFSYTPDNTTPSDAIDEIEIKFDGGNANAGKYYFDNIEGLELVGVESNAITPMVTIEADPGVNVPLGTEITFSVASSSNMGSTPSYQWLKNDSPIGGATSATYTTSTWDDGDLFSLEMTSSATGCLTKPADISNVLLATEDVADFVLMDFDCYRFTKGAPQTFASFSQGEENPDPAAPNTSDKVGKFVKGGEAWHDLRLTTNGFENIADFLSGEMRMEMDVYSEAVGDTIDITLGSSSVSWDSYPDGRHSTYRALTTKAGEWETLTFVLLFQPDESISNDDVDMVAIAFDANRASSKTFYFDNFVTPPVAGADNSECNLVEVAGLFLVEDFDCANHTSLGWDAGEDAEHGVPNPDPSGINTSDLVGSDTKDGENDWSNVQINTSGLVDITPLHEGDIQMKMDVYSPVVGATVAITLVQSDADPTGANWPLGKHSTYSATTTVANEWETLTFSLSFTPDPKTDGAEPVDPTLPTDIDRFEINFEEGEISTNKFYWDNLYAVQVEGASSEGCQPVSVERVSIESEFAIYPNPSNGVAYLMIGQAGSVEQVQITNAVGQIVDAFVPTSNKVQLKQLTPGVYNVSVITANGVSTQRLLQQ